MIGAAVSAGQLTAIAQPSQRTVTDFATLHPAGNVFDLSLGAGSGCTAGYTPIPATHGITYLDASTDK